MGVIVESAGDEHIEPGISRLPSGSHEIRAGDGTEFRPDEDSSTLFGSALAIALGVLAFSTDKIAGPWRDRGKRDLVFLVRLLNPGGLQVLQNHFDKISFIVFVAAECARFLK